jgi:hypothetical protein
MEKISKIPVFRSAVPFSGVVSRPAAVVRLASDLLVGKSTQKRGKKINK